MPKTPKSKSMARRSRPAPTPPSAQSNAALLTNAIAEALARRHIPAELNLTPDEQQCFSAAWRAASCIVDDIAASDWEVVRQVGTEREILREDSLSWLLNNRPNPAGTGIALKQSLLWSALKHGNGYAEIERPGGITPKYLWPLNAERMEVTWGKDPAGDDCLFYVYRDDSGQTVVYQAEDVLHVRGPSQDGHTGLSLFAVAAKAIASGIAAERYTLNYYGSNATIGTVVELPRNFANEDEKRSYEAQWKATTEGIRNAHRTKFVSPGTKVTTVSNTAAEAQLVEARKFLVEDILRIFNVPGHKAMIAASSQGYGKNLAEMSINYVRSTLSPWIRSIEQECNVKLIGERNPKYVQVNTLWLTRGDEREQAETGKIWIDSGVKSVNEVRASIGLDDVEGGDEHRLPSGPPEDAGQVPPPPGEPAPSDDTEEDEEALPQ